MRCLTHRKDTLGDCMWCGKHLCENCVARREGRKFYCERCATQLPSQRERMPVARSSAAPAGQPARSPASELELPFR